MKGLLELAAPALPAALVPPATIDSLRRVFGGLPAVDALGFECRLTENSDRVDLQVGILAKGGRPDDFAGSLGQITARADAWQQIARLCRAWTTKGNPLNGLMSELWLEFDTPNSSDSREWERDQLAPSVFAALPAADPAQMAGAAAALLDALVEQGRAAAETAVVERISAACPAPARVSHIGLMLGREPCGLRVHVSALPVDAVARFLTDLRWAGQADAIAESVRTLLQFADEAVLCLDVVGGTVLQVGVEYFFARKRGLDSRWSSLLDELVQQGLGSEAKAAALLGWPGSVTPPKLPEGWPEELVVEALLRDPTEFGLFERRLSHVKVTFAPDLTPTAKAYFGCGHVWETVARDAGDTVTTARVPGPLRGSVSTADAITAAGDGLLLARDQLGWWRDFPEFTRSTFSDEGTSRTSSDEWVSAYVATALAGSQDGRLRAASRQAYELLLSRRVEEPGWGYYPMIVPDADSTTWVLRLANELGVPDTTRLQRARNWVRSLIGPDGGVCTYSWPDTASIEAFLQLGTGYDGWCAQHACVTAATAALNLSPGPVAYLTQTQRADGSWAAYWWDDDEYATALAAEALAMPSTTSAGRSSSQVLRAASWAAARIDDDGVVRAAWDGQESAFATALALRTVLAATPPATPLPEPALRATRWLVDNQRANGLWEHSARIRRPLPDSIHPTGAAGTLHYVDDNALFTTATVLSALTVVATRGAST